MQPTFSGRARGRRGVRNGHDDHANVVCGVLSLLAPPAFEQPSVTAMPVAAGAPRAGVPGGYSFGADTFVAPTIGALTAPPPTPAEPAAAPGQSWRGPQDGPPPWLRKVPPVKSEDRPPATPPQTKSGGETEAQRQRVNADRSVEHRVMGNPRMPQPDAGGFHWGGSKGRAW